MVDSRLFARILVAFDSLQYKGLGVIGRPVLRGRRRRRFNLSTAEPYAGGGVGGDVTDFRRDLLTKGIYESQLYAAVFQAPRANVTYGFLIHLDATAD